MESRDQTEQEKREARKARRQRSQILAYTSVSVFIMVLALGIVLGVRYLVHTAKAEQQTQEDQQSKVDELFATESTTIMVPESTEPSVVELTPEQELDEIINEAVIEVMPLEDKVAGLFIVTPESITGVDKAVKAGDGTREALAQYAVGGIVYSAQNMRSAEQLKEMVANTRLYTKYPLFIALREEGGSASPLTEAGLMEKVDGAAALGASGDPGNAYDAGSKIGATLAELGFDLCFAPAADLADVEDSAMAERAFGADAATVSPFVTSMMQGLEEQGVTACVGHFPGIGCSAKDTGEGLVSTDRSGEDFRAGEFLVFQAAMDAGADMMMVGHITVPALSGEEQAPCPSSLSGAVVTDILREELGYDGVIITDAMDMQAIASYYGADEAAVLALRAGCDMILMPEDFEKAYNGVLQALADGTISEERVNDSLRRIYRIKYADKLEEE